MKTTISNIGQIRRNAQGKTMWNADRQRAARCDRFHNMINDNQMYGLTSPSGDHNSVEWVKSLLSNNNWTKNSDGVMSLKTL